MNPFFVKHSSPSNVTYLKISLQHGRDFCKKQSCLNVTRTYCVLNDSVNGAKYFAGVQETIYFVAQHRVFVLVFHSAVHSVMNTHTVRSALKFSVGFSGIGANEKRGCHRYLRTTEIELDRETCVG